MSYQIKVITDVATEPVTLPEVKAWCRIDDDYAVSENQLILLMSSARELLEQQTNVGFAERTLELQWNGYPIELPFSPTGEILAVKNEAGDILTTSDYKTTSYQAKSIAINSCCDYNRFTFFYGADHTVSLWDGNFDWNTEVFYTCEYKTGYTALPKSLRDAILTQIDYMFKQQGMPDNSIVSDQALALCKNYSRNLILP